VEAFMTSSSTGFSLDHLSQSAIDAIPAAVFVTTAPGADIVRSNRCAAEWCGHDASSPRRLTELLHSDSRQGSASAVDDPIAAALRGGTALTDADALLETHTGVLSVAVSIEPLRGADGQPRAALTLCCRTARAPAPATAPRSTGPRLDLAVRGARLGHWELDVESRVLTSSPLCKANHGLRPEDDLQLESVVLPSIESEYRDAFRTAVENAIDIGCPFEMEVPHEWPDGTGHWLYVAGRLIDHATMAGVSLDVTELRRDETALRESERRYREIVDTANEGIWTLDANARVTFVNRRMTEITGWTAAGMLGRHKWDFAVEDDVPAIKMRFERRRRGARQDVADVRFRHRDGREVWTLMAARPAWDDAGRFIGALELFTDITDRKRSEEALREADRRFQVMADNSPVLIWHTDANGIAFVNRYYLEFFGEPLEKILARGWVDVLHPDDGGYLEAYRAAFEQQERYEYQCRFRRRDGEYRWLHNVGLPYYGHDGEFIGFIGCSFDVTDNRRTGQALVEADRRKDEFIALLAHELRAPIAPIITAVDLLQAKGPSDQASDRLRQTIKRQAMQLSKLVDDLLDVGRITSGKLQLTREVVDIAAAVHQAVETCAPLIDHHHHTLDVLLPHEPLYVEIDVSRIGQVVCNLLTNAAKYMTQCGRIELSVVARADMAVITVRDQGIGIAPEMLARIFERFVQVDTSSRHAQGGLGIGLALVKALVEMHGGTAAASSDGTGHGSEFTVRLPLARRPEA
jgi:two-component system CheB/CheR fusion protein